MSGMIAPGADVKAMHRTFIANLKMACDRTAKSGLTLVLEPINHRDIPGYFTNTTDQVEADHRARSARRISSCSSTSITCRSPRET